MPKLKRTLGLLELTLYGLGIIIGAGIYALIGKAAGVAGNMVWLSFLIGAVIASFTGLSFAELSSMFPKDAGGYIYAKKAFKSNELSFMIGWMTIFAVCAAAATVSLGFAGYLSAVFSAPIILTAAALLIIVSAINFCGIKESLHVNVIFVAIEIIGLLIIIFLGAGHWGSVNYFETPSTIGIFSAVMIIFFAYLGFEDMVNLAEECKEPKKTLPLAIIISIVITAIFYILVSISVVSVVPWNSLSSSQAPLADVVSATNPALLPVIDFIALAATSSTVLLMMIAASRMFYGMSEEHAIHRWFSKIHPRTMTPWVAIIAVMLISCAFLLVKDIRTVAEITDLIAFMIFFVINVSVIWLRYYKPDIKRNFKVPLRIKWFPILPALGAIFCLLMISQLSGKMIMLGFLVAASGFIVYHITRIHKS